MSPIFITDLDHTLLRSDQRVSDFTTQVWNQLSHTATLSVATARSFQKSQEFLNQLHLKAPMILLDGAMVVSPQKELIDLKLIDKSLADAVIDAGKLFEIDPFIIALRDRELNEAFLFPKTLNLHQHGVLENYRNDPRMVLCEPMRAMEMNLKLVYFGDYDTLTPLTQHLKAQFGDALEYKLSPENYSDGWFLTLLHPQGDKAHALEKVMEYLGRKSEEVTVFGDSLNDIGMFQLAGTAIAVANALEEVKAVADIILPHTNDEDGVAKYLRSRD